MSRPGTDEFRDDCRTLIRGTSQHASARPEPAAHASLWYAGKDLIGDLMRAIERAEKGNDDDR